MADKKTLVRDLGELLPLDEESLTQMVENALTLPSHGAITEYWLGLLGESPDALDFMTRFNTGSSSKKHSKPVKGAANTWGQPAKPVGKPVEHKPRLAKSTNTTTSQLLDTPVEKSSKQSLKRDKQRKVDNLKDLDDILLQLESQTSDTQTKCDCMATRHPLFEVIPNCLNCGKIICVKEGLRPCSFCGNELISPEEKASIVHYLEAEKSSLEPGNRSGKVTPTLADKKKKTKFTVASGAGVNLWKQQEALFKKLEAEKLEKARQEKKQQEEAKQVKEQDQELQFYANQNQVDPDLATAQANLDNLLNFQANSAQRTKIIDQASDFELPTGSNLNMWASGVEKALQLKQQQRQLRKQEKRQDELKGRGKKVLDITIGKDGKAVLREARSAELEESGDEDDEDIEKLERDIAQGKGNRTKEAFKVVWDYEKDQNKWDKPKYVGDATSTNEDKEHDFNWRRVQQAQKDEDIEQLVAAI